MDSEKTPKEKYADYLRKTLSDKWGIELSIDQVKEILDQLGELSLDQVRDVIE
jgi:hypothetical protein